RTCGRGPWEQSGNLPPHPDTEALVLSLPVLGMTQAEPLQVIRGMVPSPLRWPTGCRFAPRCDYVFDRCAAYPPLLNVGGQQAACWLSEGGRRATIGQEARI